MKHYKTILNSAKVEIVIDKSKFIGHAKRVTSEEEAREFVAKINKIHSDATHNCYAYVADTLGNLLRFSDDGEPQGTAGMPILEVIRQKELKETAVVVTRYFGGILLGAGGLVRAYTKATSGVLLKCGIVEYLNAVRLKIKTDYQKYQFVSAFIKECGYAILIATNYILDVEIEIIIKSEYFEEFKTKISNLTLGQARILDERECLHQFMC